MSIYNVERVSNACFFPGSVSYRAMGRSILSLHYILHEVTERCNSKWNRIIDLKGKSTQSEEEKN